VPPMERRLGILIGGTGGQVWAMQRFAMPSIATIRNLIVFMVYWYFLSSVCSAYCSFCLFFGSGSKLALSENRTGIIFLVSSVSGRRSRCLVFTSILENATVDFGLSSLSFGNVRHATTTNATNPRPTVNVLLYFINLYTVSHI